MSIPTNTNTYDNESRTDAFRTPAPKRKPTDWIIATTATACVALAGITAALFLGFSAPAAQATPAQTATTITKIAKSHTHSTSSSTGGGSNSGGNGHPSHRSATPTQAEILRWQTDLTTLNYYDGDLDGVMSAETHQSIRLLQADAALPQTGDMDAATRAAMQYLLDQQTGGHAGGGNSNGGDTNRGKTGRGSGDHTHQAGSTSSTQILHWQKDLTTLSYYDGNLDGVMTPRCSSRSGSCRATPDSPRRGRWTTPPRQP